MDLETIFQPKSLLTSSKPFEFMKSISNTKISEIHEVIITMEDLCGKYQQLETVFHSGLGFRALNQRLNVGGHGGL